MVSSTRRLTALCALFATLFATTAYAQNTVDLRWSTGSQSLAKPTFAPNGGTVVCPSLSDIQVYNSGTGKVIASVGLSATAVTFSADSSKVYAAVGNSVISFFTSTGTKATQLLSDSNPIVLLASSPDKTKLAYVTDAAGVYTLVDYDLVGATPVWSQVLSAKPLDLQWSADSSKIVLDGPDVYLNDATGTLVYDHSDMSGAFNMARGTIVYGISTEATPHLQARNLSDGSLIWSAPFTALNYTGGGIVYIDRLFVPGRTATGRPALWMYRVTDGSAMGAVTPSLRTELSSNPSVDPVAIAKPPAVNKIVMAQVVDTATVPIGIAEQFSVTGSVFTRMFDMSTLSQPASVVATSGNNTAGGYPLAIIGSPEASNGSYSGIQARNGDTGAIIWVAKNIQPAPGRANAIRVSPSGSSIAVIGTRNGVYGLHILNQSGNLVQTLAVDAASVAFQNDTTFVASLADGTVHRYFISGGAVVDGASYAVPVSDVIATSTTGNHIFVKATATSITRILVPGGGLRNDTVAPAGSQIKYLSIDKNNVLYVGYEAPGNVLAIRQYTFGLNSVNFVRGSALTFAEPLFTSAFTASYNGSYIAVAGSMDTAVSGPTVNGLVRVWSVALGSVIATYNGQIGLGFTSMAFMANGGDLAWTHQDTGITCARVAPAVLKLDLVPSILVGGNQSVATATLMSPAASTGQTLTLKSNSALATVPANVTIPADATSVGFTIDTAGVDSPTTVKITATTSFRAISADLTLTKASLASVTFPKDPMYANDTGIGTVNLNGKAGATPVVVSLVSDSEHATVPASVTIPAGAASADFTITHDEVLADTTVTITATSGTDVVSGSYTLSPVSIGSVTIPKIYSGATGTGTVTLNGRAGVGGVVVTLSSDNAAAAVPASVTVAEGAKTATFTVTTTSVATPTVVTVTATYNAISVTGTLDLRPPGVYQLAASPTVLTGGNTSTFTVRLTGDAPAGGIVVDVVSSDTTVATCPATVTVPAGARIATFTVTTLVQTVNKTVTITASRDGSSAYKILTVSKPR